MVLFFFLVSVACIVLYVFVGIMVGRRVYRWIAKGAEFSQEAKELGFISGVYWPVASLVIIVILVCRFIWNKAKHVL